MELKFVPIGHTLKFLLSFSRANQRLQLFALHKADHAITWFLLVLKISHIFAISPQPLRFKLQNLEYNIIYMLPMGYIHYISLKLSI